MVTTAEIATPASRPRPLDLAVCPGSIRSTAILSLFLGVGLHCTSKAAAMFSSALTSSLPLAVFTIATFNVGFGVCLMLIGTSFFIRHRTNRPASVALVLMGFFAAAAGLASNFGLHNDAIRTAIYGCGIAAAIAVIVLYAAPDAMRQ